MDYKSCSEMFLSICSVIPLQNIYENDPKHDPKHKDVKCFSKTLRIEISSIKELVK